MKTESVVQSILNRGVEEIIDKKHFALALRSPKKLRIKFGIDPTTPFIHLGRAVPLRKLRAFQDLGHTIVLIIGDFTAMIGDPSDKLQKRPMLTREHVESNMKTYIDQLGKILDMQSVELHYNSEWLSAMSAQKLLELAESFSIQQILVRRNFKDRLDREEEISLREILYPILQGYDSVAVRADIEVGGFDQLFNVLAGRVIQKFYQQPQQDVLATQMLEGTDGRKMSASWGNIIAITDEPSDMFGKIMSISDSLIEKYFLLCTDVPEKEINVITTQITQELLNPKDAKLRLAEEIVMLYYGVTTGEKERKNFVEVFSKKKSPLDMPTLSIKKEETWEEVLIREKIVDSKSELKRLINEGAIDFNDHIVRSPKDAIIEEGIAKIGKKKFVRILL